MAWSAPSTRATGFLVTSTVWNQDCVSNPIALRAGESAWGVEQTTVLTGSQNDFSLSSISTYLRCNNATALVFTGFTVAGAAPPDGARVIVHNIGSSTVRVADQDAGSTAAYRAIHPSTRGQIIGANGAICYVYDTTTDRWRLEWVLPGSPISVTYAAGDYTGSGTITWTVAEADVLRYAYYQIGKTLWINSYTDATTVSGTGTQLRITLPNSFAIAGRNQARLAYVADNGTARAGLIQADDAATYVFFNPDLVGGNWAAATNATGTSTGGFVPYEVA